MKQGEIWNANLDPTRGSEQSGFRPVLVISGNLLNTHAPVVIICPITSKIKRYKGNPLLMPDEVNNLKNESEVMIYHVRSIAKERLVNKVGDVTQATVSMIIQTLNDILRY
jgi:mRNA interferase MazF